MSRPGAAELEALRDKARRLRRLGLAGSLKRECAYQQGRDDRAAGRGCLSANGAYLNGWYGRDELYYVTESQIEELRRL